MFEKVQAGDWRAWWTGLWVFLVVRRGTRFGWTGQCGTDVGLQAGSHSPGRPFPGDKSETAAKVDTGPIDLTLVLVDTAVQAAALPLSAYAYLSRQLEPKLMKADFMTDVAKSDLVFQVFLYPLTTFREKNTDLDIRQIQEIRFVFDRTKEGVVVIDNIGFWRDLTNAAM